MSRSFATKKCSLECVSSLAIVENVHEWSRRRYAMQQLNRHTTGVWVEVTVEYLST